MFNVIRILILHKFIGIKLMRKHKIDWRGDSKVELMGVKSNKTNESIWTSRGVISIILYSLNRILLFYILQVFYKRKALYYKAVVK